MKSMRNISISLVALACMVAFTGCSNNSTVTGPSGTIDETPPPAPAGLTLSTQAEFHRLVWTPSAAPDVVGYEVYQYLPDPSRDNSFVMIGESSENSLILTPNQEDVVAYFRVKAVDSSGNRSAASVTFTANLSEIAMGGGGAGAVNPGVDPRGRIEE